MSDRRTSGGSPAAEVAMNFGNRSAYNTYVDFTLMPGFSFSKRGMMMFSIVLPSESAWLYVFQYCSVTVLTFGDAADDVPEIANIDPPKATALSATPIRANFAVLPR